MAAEVDVDSLGEIWIVRLNTVPKDEEDLATVWQMLEELLRAGHTKFLINLGPLDELPEHKFRAFHQVIDRVTDQKGWVVLLKPPPGYAQWLTLQGKTELTPFFYESVDCAAYLEGLPA